jgi:hypothetical protein
MRLAKEHPRSEPSSWYPDGIDWLRVVKGCYEEALTIKGSPFAGAWVEARVGWFPGLKMLATYGIVKKSGETVRAGTRAYWIMPDIEGVESALRELNYL